MAPEYADINGCHGAAFYDPPPKEKKRDRHK